MRQLWTNVGRKRRLERRENFAAALPRNEVIVGLAGPEDIRRRLRSCHERAEPGKQIDTKTKQNSRRPLAANGCHRENNIIASSAVNVRLAAQVTSLVCENLATQAALIHPVRGKEDNLCDPIGSATSPTE